MITVIALPAIWLANRDDGDRSSSRPNVAAVGIDPGEADRSTAVAAEGFDPMGDVGAMYLEPVDVTHPPETLAVAVGTHPEEVVGPAKATYSRNVGVDVCVYDGTSAGVWVTVVNVANGRSIRCTTSYSTGGDRVDVLVMSQSDFLKLADPTAAPIHVEIRK